MAIEVGTAYISILPSTSKLAPAIRKELGVVESDAKRTGDRAGASFGASFKARAGAALKGLSAAGAAGVTFLGALGVKTAAEMEQSQIAFETMLGSADKARSFIGDLTAFAKATPFEMPGLVKSASSLVAVGVEAKNVIPMLETLGNVTSGMGTGSEGIAQATRALQQMQVKGKITGEEMLQLQEAGVNGWAALAKATGKSVAELQDMSSAGKLGADSVKQLFGAIREGKSFEKFNGLMEKQAVSLTGLWSTFKDTIGQEMMKAIQPLLPLLKEGLVSATETLGPAITGVVNAITDAVGVTKDFVKWVKKNEDVIVPLSATIGVLVLGIAALALQQKIVAAGGLIKWLTGAAKATKAFAVVQGILNVIMAANPIALVVLGIAALVAGFVVAYKKSETFRRIVDGALRGVGDAFTWLKDSVVMPVFRFFGDKIGWLMNKFGDMLIGLSKVPGFGWAREAGLKMKGAAAEARGLGDSLKGIKSPPKVRITVEYGSLQDAVAAADTLMGKLSNIGDYLAQPSNYTVPGNVSGPVPKNPRMATGGIVRPRPGGVDVTVAEVGRPEAVVPLDRYDRLVRASAEGRTFVSSASRVTPTKTEFVITNWRKGEGYLREIAENAIHDDRAFRGAVRGMA